jgi:hypothetical protein
MTGKLLRKFHRKENIAVCVWGRDLRKEETQDAMLINSLELIQF